MISVSPEMSKKQMRQIVNLSDSNLKTIAQIDAGKDFKESKARKFGNFLFKATPIVDTLAVGALAGTVVKTAESGAKTFAQTSVPLSKRLSSMVKRGGMWAGALVLMGLVGGATHKASSKKILIGDDGKMAVKSTKFSKFAEKHRGLVVISELAAFIGLFIAGAKGLPKLVNKIKPTSMGKWTQNAAKVVSESIDKSLARRLLNDEVKPAVDFVANKAPKLAKATPHILNNIAYGLIGLGFLSKLVASAKFNKTASHNYNQLKELQVDSAKTLIAKSK